MRDDALSRLLQATGRFRLGSVTPSGDCFYDCIHELLLKHERLPMLADAAAMRDLVADSLTDEIFALYQMYASAGVEDFAWLNGHHAPQTLEELRAFARRRGRDSGAGHCLWADDYAINKICELADIVVLIIDEQAPASGSRSGTGCGGGWPSGPALALQLRHQRGVSEVVLVIRFQEAGHTLGRRPLCGVLSTQLVVRVRPHCLFRAVGLTELMILVLGELHLPDALDFGHHV